MDETNQRGLKVWQRLLLCLFLIPAVPSQFYVLLSIFGLGFSGSEWFWPVVLMELGSAATVIAAALCSHKCTLPRVIAVVAWLIFTLVIAASGYANAAFRGFDNWLAIHCAVVFGVAASTLTMCLWPKDPSVPRQPTPAPSPAIAPEGAKAAEGGVIK